jgi:hypothetical protein
VITGAMRAGRSVVADRSVNSLSFFIISSLIIMLYYFVNVFLRTWGFIRWRWGLLQAGCLTFFFFFFFDGRSVSDHGGYARGAVGRR